MAEVDVAIQRFFMDYVLLVAFIGLVVFFIITLYPVLEKVIVWQQLHQAERTYAAATRHQRHELFAPLHGIISADRKLRNEGIIRIIDIGVMTGINLTYYPNSTHVVAVDTKHNLEYYFKPFTTMCDHLSIKQCIEFDYNSLRKIPDEFADAVVGSFILCKTKNEAHLLNEIHRILAPGGHYYFIEHSVEREDQYLRRWQKMLTVSGIWPHLFHGCHLNRDVEVAIFNSPFTVMKCNVKKFNFLHPFALKYVKSHVMGYAMKN